MPKKTELSETTRALLEAHEDEVHTKGRESFQGPGSSLDEAVAATARTRTALVEHLAELEARAGVPSEPAAVPAELEPETSVLLTAFLEKARADGWSQNEDIRSEAERVRAGLERAESALVARLSELEVLAAVGRCYIEYESKRAARWSNDKQALKLSAHERLCKALDRAKDFFELRAARKGQG